ncbi:hypothetical protein [Edwardsiella tarda]|uniref:hypothetical protein n=1 Tax=Edwardsiella tarda TaxID=636 RepID=UPI003F65BBDF
MKSLVKPSIDEYKKCTKHTEFKRSIFIMIAFISFGLLLIFYVRIFNPEYSWLYVNTNEPKLNWIYSVWPAILGIHGTIAALSITFMGMFINQVSDNSSKHFESICRYLTLKNNNFLQFSTDAIFGLCTGIFLLVVGGGLIQYAISMAVSIYFLASYVSIYSKLYTITVNKEIISNYLSNEIKNTGDAMLIAFNECEKLKTAIKETKNIGNNILKESFNSTVIKIIPCQQHEKIKLGSIVKFNKTRLMEVDSQLPNMIHNQIKKLILDMDLSNIDTAIEIYLITNKKVVISDDEKNEIYNKVTSCFEFNRNKNELLLYTQLNKGIIDSLHDALLKSDDISIDEGICYAKNLTQTYYLDNTINQLIKKIISSSNKRDISISSMISFTNKLLKNTDNIEEKESIIQILNETHNLAKRIYDRDNYALFFKSVQRRFKLCIEYYDDDDRYINAYWGICLDNLSHLNYKAFKISTDFISNDIKFIGGDQLCINKKQVSFLKITKEAIALLSLRFNFLYSKKECNRNNDEVKNIASLIRAWLSSEFIDEMFYISESYNCLFNVNQGFSLFSIEHDLKEIRDGEISSMESSSYFCSSIALLLFDSEINQSRFSLEYIDDISEFRKKSNITTHDISTIINQMESCGFHELIDITYSISSDQYHKTKDKIINKLKNIKERILKEIENEIKNADIDSYLKNKYEFDFNASANRIILNLIDDRHKQKSNIKTSAFNWSCLISKRQLLQPIDGSTSIQSSSNYANYFVKQWINSIINRFISENIQCITIRDPQELPVGKNLSIKSKCNSYRSIYKFIMGSTVEVNDDLLEKLLPGIYYMNLSHDFDVAAGDNICTSNIDKITKDNIERALSINKNATTSHCLLTANINVSIKKTENSCIYYIPLERCIELEKEQERKLNEEKDIDYTPSYEVTLGY